MLVAQARAAFDGERDPIANGANLAAIVFRSVPGLNWAGLYFMRDEELVLGPFQGDVATTRIAVGRGVCGTAVARNETIVVDDVHTFAGHIACDVASNSEIVIPLVARTDQGERIVGVLDCDSPSLARFAAVADRAGLEALAAAYVAASDF